MERVISNNHWRQFKYRYEVPESVLAREFDYRNPETTSEGFFCYRGTWYHLDEFLIIGGPWCALPADSPLAAWHAHHADSFFSAVVIRVSEDCEEYQVGTYLI